MHLSVKCDVHMMCRCATLNKCK